MSEPLREHPANSIQELMDLGESIVNHLKAYPFSVVGNNLQCSGPSVGAVLACFRSLQVDKRITISFLIPRKLWLLEIFVVFALYISSKKGDLLMLPLTKEPILMSVGHWCCTTWLTIF